MFFNRLIAQHVRIARDARFIGLYSLYKGASCPKIPVMLNQGIHTSQQDSDRGFIYKKYVKPPKMDHDFKNMTLNRPMSPFLGDYAMTLPSTTSILQRILGTVLVVYALAFAAIPLLPNGIENYTSAIKSLGLPVLYAQIIKFVLIYPFFYHFCMGLRFIGFNLLLFLDIKTAKTTAVLALIASVALSAFCAFYAGYYDDDGPKGKSAP